MLSHTPALPYVGAQFMAVPVVPERMKRWNVSLSQASHSDGTGPR